MKKLTLILLCSGLCALAQSNKKYTSGDLALDELYITFNSEIPIENGPDAIRQILIQFPKTAVILSAHQAILEKGIAFTDEKFYEMELAAINLTGNAHSVNVLRNTFKVKAPSSDSDKEILKIAQELKATNEIESYDLVSLSPVIPPFDIPPVTSNWENLQTYMGPNPGVNMEYAWNMGLIGNGIRIRDVEYGFNKSHEEFNDVAGAFIAPGTTLNSGVTGLYLDHGTAVFGVVYGDKGSYGISGMAYGAAEMILFPEWQQSGYNRINAVSQAIANSQAGDVIIFEMQEFGVNNNYVPAEYNQTIWNLTKAATDAGIIIVAAAGNGGVNLDSAPYSEYINRGNSGAIMVGGGSSTVSHIPLNSTTYGSRVDVQGWATNVYTSGDPFGFGSGDSNQRYSYFTGTSSATAVVASCVVVLQSYYHDLTANYLTSAEMRNLLINTGNPQSDIRHVGPLPDMQQAIQAISTLGVNSHNVKNDLRVYPNPVTDKVMLFGKNSIANEIVTLYNMLGQKVYQSK